MAIVVEESRNLGVGAALGDLAFLLLIFMLTLMNSAATNRVNLPEFKNSEVFKSSKVEVLSLSQDGKLNFRDKDIDLNELIEFLQKIPANKPIQFYVDKATPFESLAGTLEAMENQGDHRLILMNKPPPEKEN